MFQILEVAAHLFVFGTASYFIISFADLQLGSISTIRSLSRSQPKLQLDAGQKSPRIIVLLPVLREAGVIENTMDHFASLAKDHPQVEIWVVATEREDLERNEASARIIACIDAMPDPSRLDSGDVEIAISPEQRERFDAAFCAANFSEDELAKFLRPTTSEMASAAAERINTAGGRSIARVLIAPRMFERKVGQLNYARSVASQEGAANDSYFAVYDADSAPEEGVFTNFVDLIADRSTREGAMPAVVQQVSCYCKNVGDGGGVMAAFRLADSIAQTRWSLGFEYQLYRRYHNAARSGSLRNLVYCIGHGCFCLHSFLDRIGGFPDESETDDLALGYLASILGEDVVPLPSLDICDPPPNPFALIKQTSFWYLGSAKFDENLQMYRARFGADVSRLQWAWFHLMGYGRKIAWAWRGMLFLTAFIVSLLLGNIWLISLIVISHILYVQVGFLQTIAQVKAAPTIARQAGLDNLPVHSIFAGACAASVIFVIRSLGPLCGSLGINLNKRAWKSDR